MSTDLLSRESVTGRRGGVWAYISPSRLNCWASCGLKFKLTYIDGIRSPATPPLFLGKVCHASLECFYRHRQVDIVLSADDVKRRMVESWGPAIDEEDMKFQSVADEQALQRQATELVAAYLKQVPPDEPRPLAVEVSAESPLVDPATGEDLGIGLLGIMDLVLDGPSGPVIVDFKTTSRSSEPLEIVHELQLSSYAWIFRRTHGRTESCLQIRSLVKTKVPKIEVHTYPARTDAHFRRLFTLIRSYLDDLDSNRFVFRPGFGCGMCDFRATHCARWCR